MEMLKSSSSSSSSSQPVDSHHYYSFSDGFYASGWPSTKAQPMYSPPQKHEMTGQGQPVFAAFDMHPPPKLEDFFASAAAGDSTETQDSSSLTYAYNCNNPRRQPSTAYLEDLKTAPGLPAFSANSPMTPGDSGAELVAYSTAKALRLGNSTVSNNMSGGDESKSQATIVAAADSEGCKKMGDSFGQRTSIYRGVTRHRWTGRYEAHLWDNSCRREGQARKGRQVYLGGYDKEEKAARAYDLAALKYWGPNATTNFPIGSYAKELDEMKGATRQEFIASLRRRSSGFSRGASIYRGVTRHHQQGRWQARIGRVAGNKDLYLGTFASEEEAAEAYDIAAIKFRGVNAVTNFEMNRYDVEAIASSPLPVGGSAKRLKLSLDSERRNHLPEPTAYSLETTTSAGIHPLPPPAAAPMNDPSSTFYHHSFLHRLYSQAAAAASSADAAALASSGELFIWPTHQSYYNLS